VDKTFNVKEKYLDAYTQTFQLNIG